MEAIWIKVHSLACWNYANRTRRRCAWIQGLRRYLHRRRHNETAAGVTVSNSLLPAAESCNRAWWKMGRDAFAALTLRSKLFANDDDSHLQV